MTRVRSLVRHAIPLGAAVALATGLLVSQHASEAAAAASAASAGATCTAAQQTATWAADQKTVLAKLGKLTTLNNEADVLKLAALGWNVPGHQWVSFENIGVAFGRVAAVAGGAPTPGTPDLVMYAPNPKAKNVTDPNGADFPYTLMGWAYTQGYNYKQAPTVMGACYPRSIWFVHERGIHDFATWGFVPVPPKESFLGQASGDTMPLPFPPGLPHIRFWDAHVWMDGTSPGVPSIGIQRPVKLGKVAGINPPGAFFYPPA